MRYEYIALDCSNIAYAGAFKLKGLSTDEQETGAIYGLLRSVLLLAEEFHCNKFLFCWDHRESDRKSLFPEYKSGRYKKRKDDPELDEIFHSVTTQLRQLREIYLPMCGFNNQFIQFGKEADDLMANLVLYYENILMVSGDEDMFQMLDLCDIYQPKSETLWDERKFVKEWGIFPPKWAEVKAIGGCTSDDIPGVPGVKEKTAAKYLRGELKHSTQAYLKILENSLIIERNRPLVKLPIKGTKDCVIKDDTLSIKGFNTMCQKLLFHSFLSTYSERWGNFFRGKL